MWKQDTLTGSTEVAVAIGLQSCVGLAPAGTCDGVNTTGDIGSPLFSGPYTPTIAGHGRADLVQNFTVQVPSNFQIGPAILSVAHFALILVRVRFVVSGPRC